MLFLLTREGRKGIRCFSLWAPLLICIVARAWDTSGRTLLSKAISMLWSGRQPPWIIFCFNLEYIWKHHLMLLCSFISYYRKKKVKFLIFWALITVFVPGREESVPKSTADMHWNPDNRNPRLCGQACLLSIKEFAFCFLYFWGFWEHLTD